MNPALKRLGFGERDRVVIIHADDVGMCQASVQAFIDLMDFGLVSSGAAMVPCPWFPLLAQECCGHQGPPLDLGVHLTLTSEWDGYRWGPISTRDEASGLLDDEGYFPRRREDVQEQAQPGAVQPEMEAQLARALAAGLDVTHVDTHMGAVAHLKFVHGYARMALEQRLPALFLLLVEAGWGDRKVGEEQLYDLLLDPVEEKDLAGDPDFSEVLDDMRGRLDAWMEETDDPIRFGPIAPPPGSEINDPDQTSPDEPLMSVPA